MAAEADSKEIPDPLPWVTASSNHYMVGCPCCNEDFYSDNRDLVLFQYREHYNKLHNKNSYYSPAAPSHN
jgi:hypothetical protein